jgi:FixJ family two-component response regulator
VNTFKAYLRFMFLGEMPKNSSQDILTAAINMARTNLPVVWMDLALGDIHMHPKCSHKEAMAFIQKRREEYEATANITVKTR